MQFVFRLRIIFRKLLALPTKTHLQRKCPVENIPCEPQIEKQAYPVWGSVQMFLATLLGGPPAGCYLISQNYKALNNEIYARRALRVGIFGTALLFLGYMALEICAPELFNKIPRDIVAMTAAIVTLSHADIYQKKRIKELKAEGQPKGSYWKLLMVVGISILGMLGVAGVLTGIKAVLLK